jgi:hypothetical protein
MACDVLNVLQESDPDEVLNLAITILEHVFNCGNNC